MGIALNTEAFDDKLELLVHERKAAEGLLLQSRQKIHLRSGQFLYRFVDASKLPRHRWTEGSWWVDYENYLRICQLAETGGSTLGYAARLMLAVSYEFSAVNGVVRALLSHPLDALAGRGRWQADKNPVAKDMVWRPSGNVMQLYIPRLSPMPGTLPVGNVAFS